MQGDYSEQYVHLWQNHWWWQSRHDLVLKAIRARRKRSKSVQIEANKPWRILDIGCGGGVAFDDFSQFGEVYGIEPDEHLAHAIPKWEDRIEQRFFDADYAPEEPFDLVLMLDVLEHIEQDEDALLSLRKILRPDGFAIITVPALMSLWSAHDEVNHHFRRYTASNLKTLLTSTGFQVHRLHYFFSWSLPLLYFRKLIAKKKDNYAVTVPPKVINGLFSSLSNFENMMRRLHVQFPLGSSLFAIVSRSETSPEKIGSPPAGQVPE